jgi:hypothetical protein
MKDTLHTPSEAKINANRENAKKSTGPRSPEGKAASSRNGLKHGLCANQHLLPGEDPEDFQSLLHDLFQTFCPVGDAEEKLVLRIAAAQWRLDRAFPMEAGIYRERFQDVAAKDRFRQECYARDRESAERHGDPLPPAPAPIDERDLPARAFNFDCAASASFTRLARYETSIELSIDRSLRQLKAFQAARNTPKPDPQPDSGPQNPPESEHYETNPKNEPGAPSAEMRSGPVCLWRGQSWLQAGFPAGLVIFALRFASCMSRAFPPMNPQPLPGLVCQLQHQKEDAVIRGTRRFHRCPEVV